MNKSVVISVLGDDSPGLVKSLSKLIVAHQGEWVESRMASLSGKFAGILRVDLPSSEFEAFKNDLQNATDLGLSVIFEESLHPQAATENQFEIELIGQDQPGIIHRIASVMEQIHANVDELETEVIEASMSGEKLFKANIKLHIASDVHSSEIRTLLEELANELIVDIELLEGDT
ncbi:MAG: ACT domain-containing protein [Thiomicrorhabdus sp.]|nr:ACT domain-containing protein [Thiomicrorhabdus sp.]